MTKAEYPVAEQQSREPPLTTELPAFVMREPWLDRKMRMWLTMLMVDTPTAIGFAFTWLWFSGSILMVSALSGRIFPVFDTPMERWISNGSRVVHAARVARIAFVL